MSEKWYPIINYELCVECGACFGKCSHGVYEKEGEKPVVVAPKNCIEGCRGCQALCDVDAIQYAGDTGEQVSSSCGCCCNSNCDC